MRRPCLRRWDAASGKPLQDGDRAPIQGLYGTVALRDGKSVITATYVCAGPRQGDAQATWEVRDVGTGKVLRRIGETGAHGGTVWNAGLRRGQLIALSSDDATLAVICDYRGNTVALYDVGMGKEERRLKVKSSRLLCVAVAPDDNTIAAGDEVGKLHLWERKTGQEVHTIPVSPVAVRTTIFLPGGKELATVAEDGVIRLWDTATGKEIRPRDGCLASISALAVPVDGKTIFTGSREPFARQWDAATGKELGRFAGIVRGAYGISCSPDGKTLAAVDQNYDIVLWDVASGKEIRRWKTDPDDNATSVAFSPDGETLASGGVDGFVCLWGPATGKQVRRTKTGHLYWSGHIAFSGDGKLIASSGGIVQRLWETATGNERLVIDVGKEPAEALAISPDASMVAVACRDGRVRIYAMVADPSKKISLISKIEKDKSTLADVPTAKELHVLESPGNQGHAVAFSPDGRLLAAGGGDGLVHLWDTATWKERKALRGHKGDVTALAFVSNERLVSASADTTVLVWDVSAAAP